MKLYRNIFFVNFFLFSFNFLISQDAIKVYDSKIKTVTIYDGFAEINRDFEIDLKKGNTTIELYLPRQDLDSNSLSAWANDESVKIINIYCEKYAELHQNSSDQKNDKVFLQRKNELDAKIVGLQNGLEMIEKLKVNFLNNILISINEDDVNLEEWKSSVETLKNQAIAIAAKSRSLEDKKWQFELENKKLKIDEAHKQNSSKEQIKIVLIVQVNKNAKLTPTLKYLVKGPRWRPDYDINLDETNKQLKLKYFAKIIQNTGENWNDVNLIVSTVDLKEAFGLPILPRKFLDLEEIEKVQEKLVLNREAIEEIIVEEDPRNKTVTKIQIDEEPSAENNEIQETGVEENKRILNSDFITHGIKTEFLLKNHSVLSSDLVQKVVISNNKLPYKIRLELTPSECKEAYRRLSFSNTTGKIFLPGNVNIALNSRPIGKSELPLVFPQSDLSLSFGTLTGVYGLKETVELTEKEQKQIDNKNRIIKYNLHLTNYTKEEQTFRLYETIPVSKISDVFVIFNEKESGFITQLPGLLYQDLTLKPGEKKSLFITYKLESKGDFSF